MITLNYRDKIIKTITELTQDKKIKWKDRNITKNFGNGYDFLGEYKDFKFEAYICQHDGAKSLDLEKNNKHYYIYETKKNEELFIDLFSAINDRMIFEDIYKKLNRKEEENKDNEKNSKMKLVCSCGNEEMFTKALYINEEDIPRGIQYTPITIDCRKFNIASEYEWCYIICNNCDKKIVIST